MKSLVLTIAVVMVGVLSFGAAVGVLVGGSPGAAVAWVTAGGIAAVGGFICGSAILAYRQRGSARRTEEA